MRLLRYLSAAVLVTAVTVPAFAGFASFSASPPVPVPPLAAAWGYTKRTFHEPFKDLHGIDTGNTGAAGFNFYLQVAWPNATGGGNWAVATPTDQSLLSIGAGGLMISGFTGNGEYSIGTAIPAGNGHIGSAFAGGAYYEVQWSVNTGCSNSGQQTWPVIEEQSLNFLQATATEFIEQDHVENFPSGNNNPTNDANFHDFTFSGGMFTRNSILGNNWPAISPNPQIYGIAWVPQSLNGGVGLIRKSYNGVTQTGMDITYSSSTGSTPPADPSNFTGVFSVMDADSQVILITAGAGCPQTIGYVDVWQRP